MNADTGKSRKAIARCCSAVVLLLTLFCYGAVADEQPARQNLDGSGLALEGYDPVSYHGDTPRKGQAELALQVDGATYYFIDQANRTLFNENPEKFKPAYGGWCAWAMLDGERVEVDPESFKIIEGRTYLFYNGFWGDTLKKWNQRAEKVTDTQLVRQADGKWKDMLAR